MSSWAKPGVKCVCISDEWSELGLEIAGVNRAPMLNEVLTIAAINASGDFQFAEIPRVSLSPVNGVMAVFWHYGAFRPLVSIEDDVALFRHHLAGAPAGVDA